MSGIVRKVPPMSRDAIRQVAQKVRKINEELTGKNSACFPIVEFLDLTLAKHFKSFVLEICSQYKMGDAHGLTFPDENLIQIREDVYEGACLDKGRDRMTLAHELGHLVLHSNLGFARMEYGNSIPAYMSSEWQANAFAEELLIAAEHVNQCRYDFEVSEMFKVSDEAANVQLDVFRKDRIR
jgi:Zn-dependent peptidase ImmA (M78 family)